METAYIETTVIGHLAGRLHSDPLIAERQKLTRQWWPNAYKRYRVLISQLVRDEYSGGDPAAANERFSVLGPFEMLETNDEVQELSDKLTASGAIPPSEPRDALHVAIAAYHGIEYLVTWNFKHIANAATRGRIEAVCRGAGFEPPIICTPEELAGENANEISDG